MRRWFAYPSLFRRATLIGVLGVFLALFAFMVNYHFYPVSFFGYDIIVAPAMLMLSFFTEEINFVPKMLLFLSGQFLGYFLMAYLTFAVLAFLKNCQKSKIGQDN